MVGKPYTTHFPDTESPWQNNSATQIALDVTCGSWSRPDWMWKQTTINTDKGVHHLLQMLLLIMGGRQGRSTKAETAFHNETFSTFCRLCTAMLSVSHPIWTNDQQLLSNKSLKIEWWEEFYSNLLNLSTLLVPANLGVHLRGLRSFDQLLSCSRAWGSSWNTQLTWSRLISQLTCVPLTSIRECLLQLRHQQSGFIPWCGLHIMSIWRLCLIL